MGQWTWHAVKDDAGSTATATTRWTRDGDDGTIAATAAASVANNYDDDEDEDARLRWS